MNAERTEVAHPLARSVIAAVKGSGNAVVLPTLGGRLPLYLPGGAIETIAAVMRMK